MGEGGGGSSSVRPLSYPLTVDSVPCVSPSSEFVDGFRHFASIRLAAALDDYSYRQVPKKGAPADF